jgi:O-methyltransferase involved in polyketide biosynthesis
MGKTIKIELGNVQKTLLLPLWGRAVETRKEHPLIVDKPAVDIINQIGYDFAELERNYNEENQLSWVIRCINVDRTIKEFLKQYPDATIVNIGCGLDTTFERVDNHQLLWYELDMPDTIALRELLIPGQERRKTIRASVFDDTWFDQITVRSNVLFVASGVFYYFEEEKLKKLFIGMAKRFPEGRMIFDAASPSGVKILNKSVIEGGGMDENSYLKWGLKRAKNIETWGKCFEVIDEYPYYANLPKDVNISLKAKMKIWVSNHFNFFSMVYLKFKKMP